MVVGHSQNRIWVCKKSVHHDQANHLVSAIQSGGCRSRRDICRCQAQKPKIDISFDLEADIAIENNL
jgi:hypothetical protein